MNVLVIIFEDTKMSKNKKRNQANLSTTSNNRAKNKKNLSGVLKQGLSSFLLKPCFNTPQG